MEGYKVPASIGEMAVVKTALDIKSKLDDRGETCVYLGWSPDHGEDVYRFLRLKTNGILNT